MRSCLFYLKVVPLSVLLACASKQGNSVGDAEIKSLLHQTLEGGGIADHAEEQLQALGDPARQTLIRMLRDPQTPEEEIGAIVNVLLVYLPAADADKAIDDYIASIKDSRSKGALQALAAGVRSARSRSPK